MPGEGCWVATRQVKGQNNRAQGQPRSVVNCNVLSDKAIHLEMKESRVSETMRTADCGRRRSMPRVVKKLGRDK
jgi:hypothetical protein